MLLLESPPNIPILGTAAILCRRSRMATLAYEVEESQEVSEKLQMIEELLALYVWHPSCWLGHVGPFLVTTKTFG